MKKLALIAALLLSACSADQVVERQQVSITSAQRANIYSGVKANLRDPSSAQFQNLRVTRDTLQSGKVHVLVCGKVNARNGFGGYNGFKWFNGTLNGDNFTVGLLAVDGSDWVAASVCS